MVVEVPRSYMLSTASPTLPRLHMVARSSPSYGSGPTVYHTSLVVLLEQRLLTSLGPSLLALLPSKPKVIGRTLASTNSDAPAQSLGGAPAPGLQLYTNRPHSAMPELMQFWSHAVLQQLGERLQTMSQQTGSLQPPLVFTAVQSLVLVPHTALSSGSTCRSQA